MGKAQRVATGRVIVDRCPEGLAQLYRLALAAAERVEAHGFADGRPWGEQDARFLTFCDYRRRVFANPPVPEESTDVGA